MLEALKENIFDAEEEAASLKTDMTSVREAIFGMMAGDEEALLDVLTFLREQPAIGTINFRLWSGWAGFTTSCRRTFERNLRLLVSARFVSLVFHAVSVRPELVKLLALSNFQAHRRSPCDSSFTGHFGQICLNS